MNYVKIQKGVIKLYCSYNRDLIFNLKHCIPCSDRRPIYRNGKFSHWEVLPKHARIIENLIDNYLGIKVNIPDAQVITPTTQKLLRVEYIGSLKDREDGTITASGATCENINDELEYVLSSLDWNVVFTEKVLKKWFVGNKAPKTSGNTLYSFLNVKHDASLKEIKKAFRLMVKRYHPDINKDEDAEEMTQKIYNAYNVLRSPPQRKKYDIGLRLEAKLKTQNEQLSSLWKIPVRCGLILAEGKEVLGRFHIEKILQWNDIVKDGKILVTSWDKNINAIKRSWV